MIVTPTPELSSSLYSGGQDSSSTDFSDVLQYEPTSQHWTCLGDMTTLIPIPRVSTVTLDIVAPLCTPYVQPPFTTTTATTTMTTTITATTISCVPSTCDAANCLTYPSDYPCSDYPAVMADKVTWNNHTLL